MDRYFHHNIVSDLQGNKLCKGATEEAKKTCYNGSMTDENMTLRITKLRKRQNKIADFFMSKSNNDKHKVLHNAMEKKVQLRHEILAEAQKKNTTQQKGSEV